MNEKLLPATFLTGISLLGILLVPKTSFETLITFMYLAGIFFIIWGLQLRKYYQEDLEDFYDFIRNDIPEEWKKEGPISKALWIISIILGLLGLLFVLFTGRSSKSK